MDIKALKLIDNFRKNRSHLRFILFQNATHVSQI